MIIDLVSKLWKALPRPARTAITRSVQPKFTVSAAGIVFNKEGRVLLLDHVLRPHSGWGLPGGFVEAYEQPEAALRRELKEETDLDLRDVSVYKCRTFKRHIEIVFIAKGVGEAFVKSREIKQLIWAGVEDMPSEMSLDLQFLIKKVLEDRSPQPVEAV